MPKRPPKPEDRLSQPRRKRTKEPSIAEALEAARRITDAEVIASDINIDGYFQLDDRSFAIMRGANVENALELALLKRIVIHKGERRNLFRGDGPLGTFSNKITMGYALGLFGEKTKSNLDIIRHVRNVFAHAKQEVSFETKEIDGLCAFLKVPPIKINNNAPKATFTKKHDISGLSPARRAYHASTFVTEISLMNFCSRISAERIRMLGGNSGEPIELRVSFDDSLP